MPQWLAGASIVVNTALIAVVWESRISSDKKFDDRLTKLEDRADMSDTVRLLADGLNVLRGQVEVNMRGIASIQAKQDERSARFSRIEQDIQDLRARMPK